jgi:hypothetical protein
MGGSQRASAKHLQHDKISEDYNKLGVAAGFPAT